MILIDTNAFVLLILGLIDRGLIKTHKTTSIYSEQDYEDLLTVIGDLRRLVVLPNVWTEADNLLNRLSGNYKWPYISLMKELTVQTTEKYLTSKLGTHDPSFIRIGLTDALLLELSKSCDLLITGDSDLSDLALANGIKVYDIKRKRNENLLQ